MSRPPLFQVGQAVVRVKPGDVSELAGCPRHAHVPPIELGTIVTICRIEWLGDYGLNFYVLFFEERPYPFCYWEGQFAPVELLPEKALTKLLEETLFAPAALP